MTFVRKQANWRQRKRALFFSLFFFSTSYLKHLKHRCCVELETSMFSIGSHVNSRAFAVFWILIRFTWCFNANINRWFIMIMRLIQQSTFNVVIPTCMCLWMIWNWSCFTWAMSRVFMHSIQNGEFEMKHLVFVCALKRPQAHTMTSNTRLSLAALLFLAISAIICGRHSEQSQVQMEWLFMNWTLDNALVFGPRWSYLSHPHAD